MGEGEKKVIKEIQYEKKKNTDLNVGIQLIAQVCM